MRLRSLLGATTLLLTALATTLVTVPGSATASGSDRLDEIAAANQMSRSRLVKLMEDDSLHVGARDHLYYVDPPSRGSGGAVTAELAPFPLNQTFLLHSAPGSNRTIYLDFDGATVSGSAWNGAPTFLPAGAHPAWDPAGDGAAFSDPEKERV
ncbi:MAG: hypothetical protein QOF58_3535, partial [Pseudonocardiales bacterium]|nr:hypothetical protein [Pseudonocardiales bacterium]